MLGLVTRTRWPSRDPSRKEAIRRGLVVILVQGGRPDARSAALIGLLPGRAPPPPDRLASRRQCSQREEASQGGRRGELGEPDDQGRRRRGDGRHRCRAFDGRQRRVTAGGVVGSRRDADRRGPAAVAARRRVRQAADQRARGRPGRGGPRRAGPGRGRHRRRRRRRSGGRPRSGRSRRGDHRPRAGRRARDGGGEGALGPGPRHPARQAPRRHAVRAAGRSRHPRAPRRQGDGAVPPHALARPRLLARGRRTPRAHRRARRRGTSPSRAPVRWSPCCTPSTAPTRPFLTRA